MRSQRRVNNKLCFMKRSSDGGFIYLYDIILIGVFCFESYAFTNLS